MRNLALASVFAPVLLLGGCGQSVVGKYQRDGIPDMASLELRADGTAVQSGEMLGHQIASTGTSSLMARTSRSRAMSRQLATRAPPWTST
jgi:hypothetical protein